MYIIYKITNKVNNKIYIGFTSKSIEKRFKQHCYLAEYKHGNTYSIIHKAINKYGVENFSIETIYSGENKEEVLSKEDYYINLYNSYIPNGYNIAKGGNNPPSWEGKRHTEETKEKIKMKLIEFYSKDENRIKHIGKNNPNYNHKWSEEMRHKCSISKMNIYKNEKNPNSKRIIAIFPNGMEKEFECIKFAAKYFNTNIVSIHKVLKLGKPLGRNSKVKGIMFKYL